MSHLSPIGRGLVLAVLVLSPFEPAPGLLVEAGRAGSFLWAACCNETRGVPLWL